MAAAKHLTTTLSTKGRMVLPKAVRDRRGWGEGVRLIVEDTPEGVLPKADVGEPLFAPTRLEDVFGMLKREGPPMSLKDMDQAITDEVCERWTRFERTGTDYED